MLEDAAPPTGLGKPLAPIGDGALGACCWSLTTKMFLLVQVNLTRFKGGVFGGASAPASAPPALCAVLGSLCTIFQHRLRPLLPIKVLVVLV